MLHHDIMTLYICEINGSGGDFNIIEGRMEQESFKLIAENNNHYFDYFYFNFVILYYYFEIF